MIYSEALQQIDLNDSDTVKDIASEMDLTAVETVKFKVILNKLSQQDNVCTMYTQCGASTPQ